MSRVHDALRRAAQTPPPVPPPIRSIPVPPVTAAAPAEPPSSEEPPHHPAEAVVRTATATVAADDLQSLDTLLDHVEEIPYDAEPESLIVDPARPHDAPMEEFRSLRTRLNHLQTLQPIHSVVVTSPSPAEGKSFAAANLAIAQAQLAGNRTLLCDFDFRRPSLHESFQISRSPGLTDYLLGKAQLHEIIKKISGLNLYLIPAGEAVINPLELLNLPDVKRLLELLPAVFNWIIMDTPPLLFAADANLVSTLSHGTILVVRIGATTIDSVTRAMQSLCQNNVLGVVVNGARRGELYSKYAYYHSYYTPQDEKTEGEETEEPAQAGE
jgi:receptor protein-tyrosine kinase